MSEVSFADAAACCHLLMAVEEDDEELPSPSQDFTRVRLPPPLPSEEEDLRAASTACRSLLVEEVCRAAGAAAAAVSGAAAVDAGAEANDDAELTRLPERGLGAAALALAAALANGASPPAMSGGVATTLGGTCQRHRVRKASPLLYYTKYQVLWSTLRRGVEQKDHSSHGLLPAEGTTILIVRLTKDSLLVSATATGCARVHVCKSLLPHACRHVLSIRRFSSAVHFRHRAPRLAARDASLQQKAIFATRHQHRLQT